MAESILGPAASPFRVSMRSRLGFGTAKYASAWSIGLGAYMHWFFDSGSEIYASARDSGGETCLVGNRKNGASVWKVDDSGNLLWSMDAGPLVVAVAVDGADNLYLGGLTAGNLNLRSVTSGGSLRWEVGIPKTDEQAGTILFHGGSLYAASTAYHKINPATGAVIWRSAHVTTVLGSKIAADASYLYVPNDTTDSTTGIRKLSQADGSLVTHLPAPGRCLGVALDSAGNMYVAARDGAYKLDPSGAVVWHDPRLELRGLTVQGSDLYVSGGSTSLTTGAVIPPGAEVRRLSQSDGAIEWEWRSRSPMALDVQLSGGRLTVCGYRSRTFSRSNL